MKIRPFSKELKSLLALYVKKGGVIDYASLECDPADGSGYSLYESAVKVGLQSIGQKTGCSVEADYSGMKGQKISIEKFLGSHFSFKRNALIVRGKTSPHLNDYFIAGDTEIPANVVQISQTDYFADGYAAAFAEPPYGMDLDAVKLNQMFFQIMDFLFSGLTSPLEIFDWSGKWSRYFEAGAEWWGAYMWTVFNQNSHQLVVIGASTTD